MYTHLQKVADPCPRQCPGVSRKVCNNFLPAYDRLKLCVLVAVARFAARKNTVLIVQVDLMRRGRRSSFI